LFGSNHSALPSDLPNFSPEAVVISGIVNPEKRNNTITVLCHQLQVLITKLNPNLSGKHGLLCYPFTEQSFELEFMKKLLCTYEKMTLSLCLNGTEKVETIHYEWTCRKNTT